MSPEREAVINDHKVQEYYWAGEMVVYVDYQLTEETFEEASKRLAAGEVAK